MTVKTNETECVRLESEIVEEGVWKIIDLIPERETDFQAQEIDHEFGILLNSSVSLRRKLW